MNLDTIVCSKAEDWLPTLPDASVDMVLTSPPYNLRNTSGGGVDSSSGKWANNRMKGGYGETHSDDMPHDQYIAWQREILTETMRVVKNDGCIFYNHKWRVQDGLFQRLADDITVSFPVRQIIIWDRGSGFNFNDGYFCPSYEVIYLIARSAFKMHNKMNCRQDVWRILPSTKKDHPNSFPISLAEMCILAGSDKGDVVLDMFMGAGTTAEAAQRLERHFIGCDSSPGYVKLANERLAKPWQPALIGG